MKKKWTEEEKKERVRALQKAWRAAHPEYGKEYYRKNAEKLKFYVRRRAVTKREEINKYALDYYYKHREEILKKIKERRNKRKKAERAASGTHPNYEKMKAWREVHPEKVKEYTAKQKERRRLNRLEKEELNKAAIDIINERKRKEKLNGPDYRKKVMEHLKRLAGTL